jgi:hypothetical protein
MGFAAYGQSSINPILWPDKHVVPDDQCLTAFFSACVQDTGE